MLQNSKETHWQKYHLKNHKSKFRFSFYFIKSASQRPMSFLKKTPKNLVNSKERIGQGSQSSLSGEHIDFKFDFINRLIRLMADVMQFGVWLDNYCININLLNFRHNLFMIEEERQTLSFFEGRRGHFSVSLRLTPDTNYLDIQVQSTKTMERYIQFIDGEFIAKNENLSCFRDPAEIFQFLSEHFNEAVIEDGTIKFLYSWGSAARRRQRMITTELLKQEADQLQLARLKIKSLKGEITTFAKILQQKDSEIEKLKAGLQTKKTENEKQCERMWREESEPRKMEFEEINERTKKEFMEKIEMTKRELEEKNEQTKKEYEERLRTVEKNNEQAKREFQQILQTVMQQIEEGKQATNKQFQEIIQQIRKPSFYHHAGNFTHRQYYALTTTGTTSAKILRQGSSGDYNFVNGAEILPQRKAKYRVKISKTTDRSILVGFCTSAGFGNQGNHKHVESAYYYIYGLFYEGGVYSSGLVQIGVGDEFEVEADLSTGVLRWYRGESVLKECKLPQQMQAKTVFLSILMFTVGDEVEMSV